MSDFPMLVGKTYIVKAFGCQMNMHDSERVAGLLDSIGLIEVASPEEADVVVYMTCCVREKADTRLYGQVSAMVSAPNPLVASVWSPSAAVSRSAMAIRFASTFLTLTLFSELRQSQACQHFSLVLLPIRAMLWRLTLRSLTRASLLTYLVIGLRRFMPGCRL